MNGKRYSVQNLRSVFKNSARLLGTQKHIRLHDLQHRFAAHLLESGTDIRYIQTLFRTQQQQNH